MTYRTFHILCTIGETVRSLEIVSTDINGALADIAAAFDGEVLLIQYRQ
jgi:hypothetical protein